MLNSANHTSAVAAYKDKNVAWYNRHATVNQRPNMSLRKTLRDILSDGDGTMYAYARRRPHKVNLLNTNIGASVVEW